MARVRQVAAPSAAAAIRSVWPAAKVRRRGCPSMSPPGPQQQKTSKGRRQMHKIAKTFAVGTVAALSCALSPAIQRQQEMLNPTVMIVMEHQMGSGTVLHSADDGTFVLTNYHVIDEPLNPSHPSQRIAVIFWLMGSQGDTIYRSRQDADIVARDESRDLALLKIRDKSFLTPSVAAVAPVDVTLLAGEDVYVAGAGMGHRVFLTQGLLSVVDDQVSSNPALLTSSPVVNGNSGGSLWHRRDDGHYEMIGVPQAIATEPIESPFKETIRAGVPTMSFAIPLKTVRSFLAANNYSFFDGSGPRGVESVASK
jgi:S1-C subfamily serine protease